MTTIAAQSGPAREPALTYARARLWLGMSTVGSLVAASSMLLFFAAPDRLLGSGQVGLVPAAGSLLVFVAAYACVHLVADLFGAVLLPARSGRLGGPLAVVVGRLARGVICHSVGMWAIAVSLLAGGAAAGLPGVMIVSGVVALSLLALRPLVARAIGGVKPPRGAAGFHKSPEPGFTGGIDGVFRVRRTVVPLSWRESLSSIELEEVLARRRAAIANGSWRRGRVLAFVFTLLGVAIAGLAAGPETLGTPAGIVRLSLWFTLWSFIGLLVLPSLSRQAVAAADRSAGVEAPAASALSKLDQMGDAEPARPKLIETIFHPVPSLEKRTRERTGRSVGFWDAARITLYMSSAGLGLLGRAVHCNAGRPALWAYLPSA